MDNASRIVHNPLRRALAGNRHSHASGVRIMRLPVYPSKAHSSGQARIKINGRPVYLGVYGTRASHEKFHRVIAEYLAGTFDAAPDDNHAANWEPARITVAQLVDAHRKWGMGRYTKHGKPTSEQASFKTALRPVLRLYAALPADKFGPLCLVAARSELVRARYTRTRINQHTQRIRQVFRWGVARELVPPSVLEALRSVPGLAPGEEGVTDRAPVGTVPDEHVDAMKHQVSPPVWAMIQLQLLTGMRPQEVCLMRTCDIFERDPRIPTAFRGTCWLYVPASHKTEHHRKQRLVLLGPKAQAILHAWTRAYDPTAYLFQPKEAAKFRQKKRRMLAKSPNPYQKRVRNPKRVPGAIYTPHAYANAIARACKRTGIPRWSPNRLRHNAATMLRREFGIDIAKTILGHSSVSTTEIYAEKDVTAAAKAIAAVG